MSSLFGGKPKVPPPPPPVEPIKTAEPRGRVGGADERRRRQLAQMAARMPSRFGGLGSGGAATSMLGGG